MTELEPGATTTAEHVVTEGDLASALSAVDHFPPVFATARMVALMEVAASRGMLPVLGEGELSVGVSVDVTHSAATPPGSTVRASAKFVGVEGKLYVFEVTAEDEGGEIGRGIHRRAVVHADRLLAGAARRTGRA
ncbi:MAG TPA: hotdog domain-containing protein [Thermoanaerobaculia bacterium]|jgi:predicted thioesterase